MKKILFLAGLLLCFAGKAKAQAQVPSLPADPATCVSGAEYYNTTTNTLRICGPANTWAAVGGGNAASAGTIDPTQAPYNVKADAISGVDGSTIATQNTFSSTNQNCNAATDVGKLIIVVSGGGASQGVYEFGTSAVTVTGCSGNSWTTSGTASGTVSGTLLWAIGTGNGAGLASAYTAALAANKVLALPCGAMIVESPPFIGTAVNFITGQPDIQGCNSTGNTHFIFHPQITSGLIAAGGVFFASFPASVSLTGTCGTGAPCIANGIGNQGKIENLFLTSLNGQLPTSAGHTVTMISGFAIVNSIVSQLVSASSAGPMNLVSMPGEGKASKLNLQNSNADNAGHTVIAVGLTGQGENILEDSIIAYGFTFAVTCGGTCSILNDYLTGSIQNGVEATAAAVINVENTICGSVGGGGTLGCFTDAGNAVTFRMFASDFNGGGANVPAITCSNANTVLDISGSSFISTTAGFTIRGNCMFNDRVGNTFSSTLSGFTGKYIPIGGGSSANNSSTAATNFGTNITTTNVLSANAPAASTLTIKIGFRQVTAGVGCSAASNTVNGVLSWTAGGATQSTGSGGVPALGTLTAATNGTVGNSSVYSDVTVHVDIGTQVTFVTTSVLASTGCSTVPQYVVDFSNI